MKGKNKVISDSEKFDALVQKAYALSATGAVLLSTKQIVVDSAFAAKCLEPRCENYGLSRSCPPHVEGPQEMEKMLKTYSSALFFKIDVPKEMLFSSDRAELFSLLHQTAAGVEIAAVGMGFDHARAFAGGSCKQIFCDTHLNCRVVGENKECRHPDKARPSMSGFGVDVAKLYEAAGWHMTWESRDEQDETVKMSNLCGLVFIC